MKRFRDLKKGDSIFHISLNKNWWIHDYKILSIEYGGDDVKIILDNDSWSGYYFKDFVSARDSKIWADREEAIKYAMIAAKRRFDQLTRNINDMISEYDKIEKFMEEYDESGRE